MNNSIQLNGGSLRGPPPPWRSVSSLPVLFFIHHLNRAILSNYRTLICQGFDHLIVYMALLPLELYFSVFERWTSPLLLSFPPLIWCLMNPFLHKRFNYIDLVQFLFTFSDLFCTLEKYFLEGEFISFCLKISQLQIRSETIILISYFFKPTDRIMHFERQHV